MSEPDLSEPDLSEPDLSEPDLSEPVMSGALSAWIEAYVRAWNSNDPAEIGALFTADATYSTEPYREPWPGREAIVHGWLAARDEPGTTTFTWHPVSVTPEIAIITGTTTYPDRAFSNLWLIRLDPDGVCREFSEWWMEHPS